MDFFWLQRFCENCSRPNARCLTSSATGNCNLTSAKYADYIAAIRFLLDNERARGPFNLIAPQASSNADFMRALARALHRPYWFHVPSFMMKTALGEMSVMVLEGRRSEPKRLTEAGYQFKFPTLESALADLYGK